MPKIREAKIKIESVIENLDSAGLPEGDAERNTSEVSGFIHYTDEGILLTYSEENEGAVVYSDELDLCEECGEWKRVIVRKRFRVPWFLMRLIYK